MHPVTRIFVLALLSAAFAAAGCRTAPPVPRRADLPTAQRLIERCNERADGITGLRSRTSVKIEWEDVDGKRRSEQGEGLLIVRKPRDLALTVGKLGSVYYWFGSDAERFWWLDMNPHDEVEDVAWLGPHVAATGQAMHGLGIPLRSEHLIELLGITPIPPDAVAVDDLPNPEKLSFGRWVRVPARPASAGDAGDLAKLLWLDAITGYPRRIRYHDADGTLVADASLRRFEPLEQEGRSRGAWPRIATRIEIDVPGRRSGMTLWLDEPTDRKIADAMFDFDRLVKNYRLTEAVRSFSDPRTRSQP